MKHNTVGHYHAKPPTTHSKHNMIKNNLTLSLLVLGLISGTARSQVYSFPLLYTNTLASASWAAAFWVSAWARTQRRRVASRFKWTATARRFN
jgi:hypothetical protein